MARVDLRQTRILIFALAVVGLTACGTGGSQTPTTSPTASVTASPSPAGSPALLTVNGGGGAGSLPPAWRFGIQYPARYLVTSDDMLTNYNTQGGSAPPRLSLTVGTQPVEGNVSIGDRLRAGDQDCITIWSTLGFHSVSDWETVGALGLGSTTVISSSTQHLGGFDFVVREVTFPGTASVRRFEAFVQLPENLSYFFLTCNANSQSDLTTVLTSFRVRTQP